jgi:ribose/xylose/arabinose/galactoside ABC-type transport system permease subunit
MLFNIKTDTGLKKRQFDFSSYMVYFMFIVVMIIFSIWLGDRFFSLNNIINIAKQTAMISVMAVGMAFVIASGNIDLSIGSTVALVGLVVAVVLRKTDNVILSICVGLAMGIAIGLINAFLVTKARIPAFLATLGTLGILKGLAMRATDIQTIPVGNKVFTFIFGQGQIGIIPTLFIWTIIILLIGHFVLNNVPFGKKVLAVGGNATAARFTGINNQKITTMVFIICSISASLAAMLYIGRFEAARYTYGDNDMLTVIAAVIIGGTSLYGGKANIIGAVVGSLLMGMINNGLIIGGLKIPEQMVARGAIIILAVGLSELSNRRRSRE